MSAFLEFSGKNSDLLATTSSGLRVRVRELGMESFCLEAPELARRMDLDRTRGSAEKTVRAAYSLDYEFLGALFFDVVLESEKSLEILNLFVVPEARGRGVGTLLLQGLLVDSRNHGFKRCVAKMNAGAMLGAFLARFGFLGQRQLDGNYLYQATSASLSSAPRPASLVTERLLMRPLELEDMMDVFRYASNPNVSRYTLWDTHKSYADTLDFIRQYAFSSYGHGNSDPYAIVLRDTGRVMGTVGCFWKSRKNRSMELGYALAEDCWGKGYCPEASWAVIGHAFESYQIERLICRCIKENHQSERVMLKLGFHREGHKRRAIYSKGQYWDLIEMSMLRDEYFKIQGSRSV